ncbi:MAG: hypothetical protein ABEI77_04725 [Halorientalis sp.]
MSTLRSLSLTLALAAALLTVGTGSFSAVDANRQVHVSVVDDDQALLGIEAMPRSPHAVNGTGHGVGVLAIENNFPSEMTLTVTVGSVEQQTGTRRQTILETHLGSGRRAIVSRPQVCAVTDGGSVNLRLLARTRSARVEKTTSIRVSCPPGNDGRESTNANRTGE